MNQVVFFNRHIKKIKIVSCVSNVAGAMLLVTSNIQGLPIVGYCQDNIIPTIEVDYENPITLQGSYTFQTRNFADVPTVGEAGLRVNVILEAEVV